MMIAEEFEVIEKIFVEINSALISAKEDFKDFIYTYTIHFEEGFSRTVIEIINEMEVAEQVFIDNDLAPNLHLYLIDLHRIMRERGDRWRVFKLEYKDGKVKANFEYDRK